MVSIRPASAEKFAIQPDSRCVAALVFGMDTGLIAERAKQIATAFSTAFDPPAEIIRIEDHELEQDPDRLLVELQTQPMFGGGKVVRTTISRRVNGPLLKQIIEDGPPAARLVVEAGQLKPSDAARKAFEGAGWAAAVPCYADTARDLSTLAASMAREAGMTIETDARALLLDRLGADRALSRGEIEKLLLYASGRTTITAQDVLDVVGDASELAMDQIVSAAASGDAALALRDFDRACAAGDTSQTLLLAIQRYFLRLHKLRALVETGKTLEDAVRSLRPPVHFKHKDALVGQCQAWPLPRLTAALGRIAATVKASRRSGAIDSALAERLLIDLSRAVQPGQRR